MALLPLVLSSSVSVWGRKWSERRDSKPRGIFRCLRNPATVCGLEGPQRIDDLHVLARIHKNVVTNCHKTAALSSRRGTPSSIQTDYSTSHTAKLFSNIDAPRQAVQLRALRQENSLARISTAFGTPGPKAARAGERQRAVVPPYSRFRSHTTSSLRGSP